MIIYEIFQPMNGVDSYVKGFLDIEVALDFANQKLTNGYKIRRATTKAYSITPSELQSFMINNGDLSELFPIGVHHYLRRTGMAYTFKCPKCEHDVVQRSLFHVTAVELCSEVEDDSLDYFELESYFDDVEVEGYYCDSCGFKIEVNSDEELVEWIKKNGTYNERSFKEREGTK